MLKQRKAFIWDLDGTLLDSYGIIVSSLRKTYQEYGLPIDEEDVHRHVIRYSVNSCIRHMEEKAGVPFATLTNYTELLEAAVEESYITKEEQELLHRWREDPENWLD